MLIVIGWVYVKSRCFFHSGYSCENSSNFSLRCGKDNKGNETQIRGDQKMMHDLKWLMFYCNNMRSANYSGKEVIAL